MPPIAVVQEACLVAVGVGEHFEQRLALCSCVRRCTHSRTHMRMLSLLLSLARLLTRSLVRVLSLLCARSLSCVCARALSNTRAHTLGCHYCGGARVKGVRSHDDGHLRAVILAVITYDPCTQRSTSTEGQTHLRTRARALYTHTQGSTRGDPLGGKYCAS
jgi:hypothetical protein